MRFLVGFFILFCGSCTHFIKSPLPSHEISHFETSSSISYKSLSHKYQSHYGDIYLENHPKVDMWIKYFIGTGKPLMKTYLERSSRYLNLMKVVFREHHLPENLVYVALIESGFSPRAHSSANAVGYWQFIRGTGKRYGLRIDGFVDERKDFVISTRAAAEYFKDLYSLFGSWPLALASYNAGEYRINRIVLKYYSRNIWYLIKRKALPKETANYFPKLIAAIRIAQNPKKYGFYNLKFHKPLSYDTLALKKSISLKKLSTHLNVSYNELKKLNPIYKGEFIPIYNKQTIIRIPEGMGKISKVTLQNSVMQAPKYKYYNYYWYRIRRGDTLSGIALKNRTTVSSLRRENRLKHHSLIRVGQRLKIPTRRLVASTQYNKKKISTYVVKSGDSLGRIAKKYNISISQLLKVNSLNIKAILITGTKITIPKNR